jgi:predicted Zn-dependent protease
VLRDLGYTEPPGAGPDLARAGPPPAGRPFDPAEASLKDSLANAAPDRAAGLWTRLARLYEKMGRFPEADDAYSQAQRTLPGSSPAREFLEHRRNSVRTKFPVPVR